MKASYEQQMKKGVLEILLLHLVAKKPTYGYEMISTLKEQSGGQLTLRDGTLYPILYRLEDDGLVEAKWHSEGGRAKPKKMYSITKPGKEALKELTQAWYSFSNNVNRVLEAEA